MSASKHISLNIALIQARAALMSYFKPLLNEAGITDQQWRIIRLLAENHIMEFHELAEQTCILRPSLTGILTRQEKIGYVIRLKPANDQRRIFLKLTSIGEKLYDSICASVNARYDVLESRFTPEKLQQLGTLLHEFAGIAIDNNKK